jgi:uncharacterized protein YjbI with pentapeptide repeats
MPDTITSPVPQEFLGNTSDLAAFQALIGSPIRTEKREIALAVWSDYKLGRQAVFVQHAKAEGSGKRGLWGKGDYIRSLTAPAIDLRGARFTDVVLGYADLRGVRFDHALFDTEHLQWMAMKGAKLQCASLRDTHFTAARLMEADLRNADLSNAQLVGASLYGANLGAACLNGANLSNADLRHANLTQASLQGANLGGADLSGANLVGADLRGANLCGCRVYGISAWDVQFNENDGLRQDLIVTPSGQPDVAVDNIEVAQFVYILLNNPKIRGTLDTVCKKGVLILGRFTAERKAVLDALRSGLRERGFLPMIFDFDKPQEKDLTETVRTLAGLSRFIVADITNPRSSPLELQAIVPDYMVPLVPIIAEGEAAFPMFKDLWTKYNWVLDPLEYPSCEALLAVIEPAIIEPALQKHAELLEAKAKSLRTRTVSQYQGK